MKQNRWHGEKMPTLSAKCKCSSESKKAFTNGAAIRFSSSSYMVLLQYNLDFWYFFSDAKLSLTTLPRLA